MPLEQTRPYHHLHEEYDRPHALLSHEDLAQRLSELVEDPENTRVGYDPIDEDIDVDDQRLIDVLVAEHYFRERENRIEPGVPKSELGELIESLPSFYGDPPEESSWMRFREQPIKDYQEGVGPEPYSGVLPNTLQSNIHNWEHQPFDGEFQDLHRSGDIFEQAWGVMKAKDEGWFDDSRFPLPDDVCENCEGKKDPNDEMCRECMRRMLGV